MFCANCGFQVGEDDVFCPNCGAPLRMDDETDSQMEYMLDSEEKPQKKKGIGIFILLGVIIVVLAAGIIWGLLVVKNLKEEMNSYAAPEVTTAEKSNSQEEIKKEEEKKDNKVSVTAEPEPTSIPTASITATPAVTQTADSNDFVFADSNARYLSSAEVNGLTEEQMTMARNEIYARHGRKFKNEEIQKYFETKYWYTPKYDSEQFDAIQNTLFNDYEKENIKLIVKVEAEKGYTD